MPSPSPPEGLPQGITEDDYSEYLALIAERDRLLKRQATRKGKSDRTLLACILLYDIVQYL